MKGGMRADEVRGILQEHTVLGLDVFEFIEIVKMAVDQGFIRQGPQMLGRLQLGRIRRQEEQVKSFRDAERLAGMPAGAIEHQHNVFLFASSYSLGEMLQGQGKDVGIHGGQEQPLGVSGRRVDKGIDVEPLIAMLHDHGWTLPIEDPARDEEWV